jgi:hypothetical protein
MECHGSSCAALSPSAQLESGRLHELMLDYVEPPGPAGPAGLRLLWESRHMAAEVIGSTHLYSPLSAVPAYANVYVDSGPACASNSVVRGQRPALSIGLGNRRVR